MKKSVPDVINNIRFNDFFDLEEIQNIQDLFSDAFGVASVITQPDGTPITRPSNFCRLCRLIRKTDKGLLNCFNSDAVIGRQNPSGPMVQECLSGGLLDAGASITVGGEHIANWFIGQVRTEEFDEQRMIQYAVEIGASQDDVLEAISEIPVMSVEQFNKVSKLLFKFAGEISEKAYNNLQLKILIEDQEKTTLNTIPLSKGFSFGIAHDITVRKQFDEALKNALSLTEATLESIQNGILVVSNQGTIIKTNAKFAAMWQIPNEILTSGDNKLIFDFVLLQLSDPDGFRFMVSKLTEKPEAETIELINLRDGHIFECISKPMYLLGEPRGRVWSFFDTTESIKVVDALRESEARLQTLLQTIPALIWLKDVDGVFLACNKMFERYIGFKESEIVGKTDYDFYNKEIADLFRENDRKAIEAGTLAKKEGWTTFALDGHRALLEIIKMPVYDSLGKLIGVLGIGHDITERERKEELFLESKEKYKIITQSTLDIIFIVNKFGKQLFFNESVERVLGYRVEELVGRSFTEFVPKSELPNYVAQLKDVFTDKEIRSFVTRVYHKDGHLVDVEINGKLIKQDGKYLGQGTIRDITERKRAEAEIKLKNEQLVKLVAEKDKFFSIIAHDLRSPFYSFLGLTQIMTEELPNLTMEQIRDIAGSMRNSAANLFRFLENLLHWAMMQQGLIPFNPEIVQLQTIIDESLEMILDTASDKQIIVTCDVSVNLEVFADRIMLQAIFRNLVSNAVKFTHKGGKISLSAKNAGNESVHIAVKDSGIGMNHSMVNNLFVLDFQTNREGTEGEPSTGLGLLLCKEFVEKQGGEISVKSREGRGSEFHFTIPCKA